MFLPQPPAHLPVAEIRFWLWGQYFRRGAQLDGPRGGSVTNQEPVQPQGLNNSFFSGARWPFCYAFYIELSGG